MSETPTEKRLREVENEVGVLKTNQSMLLKLAWSVLIGVIMLFVKEVFTISTALQETTENRKMILMIRETLENFPGKPKQLP